MAQGLFDWADAKPETSKPAPTYTWNVWDPWPAGLTDRAYYLLQIKRDLRAHAETGDEFYLERAEAFRTTIKKMDGNKEPQLNPVAAQGEA